jgi:hypothetical protein
MLICDKHFNYAIGNIIASNNKFLSTSKIYVNCLQFHAERIPTAAICSVVDYGSKGPNWVGFCLKTETECSLWNVF